MTEVNRVAGNWSKDKNLQHHSGMPQIETQQTRTARKRVILYILAQSLDETLSSQTPRSHGSWSMIAFLSFSEAFLIPQQTEPANCTVATMDNAR
jgi:hypothetical protein